MFIAGLGFDFLLFAIHRAPGCSGVRNRQVVRIAKPFRKGSTGQTPRSGGSPQPDFELRARAAGQHPRWDHRRRQRCRVIHLEQSFNDIWQVKKSRSWKTKISNYLSFLVLAPVFLLIYSSIPAFVTRQLDDFSSRLTLLAKLSPSIIELLQLLPYLLIWALFSLVYLLIPNTRVRAVSGILAGVLAGTAYLAVQWGLIDFQVGVTRYNPIYGSLAALPLLLLWMNVGWIVLLIGAEYAYAHQNVNLYELEPDYTGISLRFKKVLTLQILHRMVARFTREKKPLSAGQFSQQLEIPVLLVQHILNELLDTGLVSQTDANGSRDPAYQPSSDIHHWTIRHIFDTLELQGVNRLPGTETETLKSIIHAVEELSSEMNRSEANRLLMKL